MVDQLN